MTMRKIFTFTFIVFLFAFLSCSLESFDKKLKAVLEKEYILFVNALKTGEELTIKEVISAYSYATQKNDCADAKEPFGVTMKEIGETYPLPSSVRFTKMYKKGKTAALLYSKDADSSKIFGRPMLTFIFIKFAKEEDAWKVDKVEFMDVEKYNPDSSMTIFKMSFLSEESFIDGKVPKPPAIINEAEIPGVLEVFVKGVKATIVINGIDQSPIHEISTFRLVHGGLKFDKNTIDVVCEDKIGETEKSIELYVKMKRKSDFIDIFQYEAKGNIQEKYSTTFHISNDVNNDNPESIERIANEI